MASEIAYPFFHEPAATMLPDETLRDLKSKDMTTTWALNNHTRKPQATSTASPASSVSSSLEALLGPSPPTTTKQPGHNPHIEQVQAICVRVIESIHTRNFDPSIWNTLLDEKFTASIGTSRLPVVHSREQCVQGYAALVRANPLYDVEIMDKLAEVNVRKGTATVWLRLRVTGDPDTVQRENMSVVWLKRRNDRWLIVKQHGVRGGGFDVFE